MRLLEAVPLTLSALTMLTFSNCGSQSHDNVKRDQILPLTLGGFLKDGPETERVTGMCRADNTRTLLNCDIYNGLPGWAITEVTLAVSWSPYEKDDVRYYQVAAMIKPRTTEHVTVRLGLQLPARWVWQNMGAKGYPAK
jgi:hypothetical protein